MDARSIAATAANQGRLTAATEFDGPIGKYQYHFDSKIYQNRVFDSHGVADPSVEIHFGPNIKDWPTMCALPENLVLQVVSEIHDPVTTTDELIPSGETSSYRSNPLGLAEFTLSRKDPAYVGLAKEIHKAQEALMDGKDPVTVKPELAEIMDEIHVQFPQAANDNLGFSYDFRSKARRWFCERAGCKLPEGAGRLGKYCKRICDQTVSFQSDQLGHASVRHSGRRSSVYQP